MPGHVQGRHAPPPTDVQTSTRHSHLSRCQTSGWDELYLIPLSDQKLGEVGKGRLPRTAPLWRMD